MQSTHATPSPIGGSTLFEVPLESRSFARLHGELAGEALEELARAREVARHLLAGRTLWSISSTARGGGVAEMQRTLLPYWRGSGLDARWLVVTGPPAFFRLTKRLHNLLHGVGVGPPGLRDHDLFSRVGRAAATQVVNLVAPGDVVVLQDPQTAPLADALKRAGAIVVWRCHVGADELNEPMQAAWSFLLPYLREADAFVFTRRSFVPPGLERGRVRLLAPAIDPCSHKNLPLPPTVAQAILARSGLAQASLPGDGSQLTRRVRRHCQVLRDAPPPVLGAEPLVVALARWDRLKDPIGVMEAFARYLTDERARLVIAGPAVGAVADDPEAAEVLAEATEAWRRLPSSRRQRIQLATLPMNDLDENALIVNALQRQAAVIVKKSLQEGFGLGVTEGLWKTRPVVATRVGGHQQQIEHGRTGLLVEDPADLSAFAAAIDVLLAAPAHALELAAAGHETVRTRFLADRHFINWVDVLRQLPTGAGAARSPVRRTAPDPGEPVIHRRSWSAAEPAASAAAAVPRRAAGVAARQRRG